MARILAFTLVSSVATTVFEIFDNRTLSSEYHRRLAVVPHRKMREVGAMNWKAGRLARRLSGLSGVTPECRTACKDSYEPFESDFQAIGEASQNQSEARSKHLGDMLACMYQALCLHKGAFTCMATADACKDVTNASDQDAGMSLASLNSQMQCLCDDCPEMIQGMAGMMQILVDTLQGGMGAGEAVDAKEMKKALLDSMCPLVPALACAEEKNSCNTDNPSMQGVLNAFKEGEGDTQEDEVKTLKKECEAEGATMALPETDKYGCNNIPGLYIAGSGAAPAAAGVASLAVAVLAVLS